MIPFRVLITGINGRISTSLRNALQHSHEVYGLDRVGAFSERVLSADIAEYGQIAQAVQQLGPLDSIIHLAGNPNGNANIVGTRNIFEAAGEFQVRRVIFASSNHVTGAAALSNDDPTRTRVTEKFGSVIAI